MHGLVLSCKSLPEDCKDVIYVGRPRAKPVQGIITTSDDWGNPFQMQDQNDMKERKRVIDCYKSFLLSRPDLITKARIQLKGKRLACWCSPLSCHADILCAFANSLPTTVFMEQISRGGSNASEAIKQYIGLGISLNVELAPDPENKPFTGTTAVGIACKNGDLETLQILVSHHDVDLNKGRGTSTPLLLASAYGHVECVRELMRYVSAGRVNLNATRRDGVSALTIACQQGNAPIVRLLLRQENGQFSKIKTSQRTLFPERVTPLLLAIRCGSFECVQLLMQHPGLNLDDNVYHRQTPSEIAKSMSRHDIAELLNCNGEEIEEIMPVDLVGVATTATAAATTTITTTTIPTTTAGTSTSSTRLVITGGVLYWFRGALNIRLLQSSDSCITVT